MCYIKCGWADCVFCYCICSDSVRANVILLKHSYESFICKGKLKKKRISARETNLLMNLRVHVRDLFIQLESDEFSIAAKS